jgi:hypothetical protein
MSQVHASIMAVLVQAALVTVAPAPEDSCPSPAQVQAALETHAPRLVAENVPGNLLILSLSPTLATGEMSLSLMDKAGIVKLYRVLPPPPGDRARDCAALADTVAFIVDRYFNEVELPKLPERKPPPPPPQPPPAKLASPIKLDVPGSAVAATVGRRIPGGVTDLGGIELKLTGGVAWSSTELAGGQPWVDLSAGIVGTVHQPWNHGGGAGSADATRAGADLAFLLGWPVGHGRLYAGPLASIEMIWLDATYYGQLHHEIYYESAAGLRAGYQYFWQKYLFARADITGCAALVRHRFDTLSDPSAPLFESPPAYLTFSFGIGIWF